jgi:hypothetical protein
MGVTKAHKIPSVIELYVVTAIHVFYVMARKWKASRLVSRPSLRARTEPELREAVATEPRERERKRSSHFPGACRYNGRGDLARGSVADGSKARRRR